MWMKSILFLQKMIPVARLLHPDVSTTGNRLLLGFFVFVFLCGPFLKSLLNVLPYCFFFMLYSFGPWGMWGLSSLTRNPTASSYFGRQGLNHWITREVPLDHSLLLSQKNHDIQTMAVNSTGIQGYWGTQDSACFFLPPQQTPFFRFCIPSSTAVWLKWLKSGNKCC